MLILIPVEKDNGINSTIVPESSAKKWALVDFERGEMNSLTFYDKRESIEADWIDFVILENRYENYMDFMQEGMMVLVRREGQDSIELLIEAFKFKELDEAGIM
jgi:predicted Fe-Mo cluster-binding NifX family protein